MSDAKWHKLFVAVNESGWQPSLVTIKFVDSDEPEPRLMRWPGPNSFWGPPQWVDTPEFGPIELRSIEWLMIPAAVIEPTNVLKPGQPGSPQDLTEIRSALSRVGQFPMEETSEGLKVIGYSQ